MQLWICGEDRDSFVLTQHMRCILPSVLFSARLHDVLLPISPIRRLTTERLVALPHSLPYVEEIETGQASDMEKLLLLGGMDLVQGQWKSVT